MVYLYMFCHYKIQLEFATSWDQLVLLDLLQLVFYSVQLIYVYVYRYMQVDRKLSLMYAHTYIVDSRPCVSVAIMHYIYL